MQMYRIFSMIAGMLLLLQPRVNAQAGIDTTTLFAEMTQLQSVYKAHALAFDVHYTYASELHPDAVLDSLHGRLEMSGNYYHYWLDSMETMVNANYSVTLFRNDKLMYLAKPSAAMAGVDPLMQLRVVLQRSGISSCAVTQQGALKVLRIDFGPQSSYKGMEMGIEKKTGYVTYMRYIMKTAMLMGAGGEAQVAKANAEYGEYAIVQTTFDHYKQLPANNAVFDENAFFYKEGDAFKTTPAYSEYRIFKGSPNL